MDRPLPAYDGDEPYICVTYSHKDTDVVYPQIRWLQDQGFNVDWDDGISPGAMWLTQRPRPSFRGIGLPIDVTLTGDTSRTLDEIENPTHPSSIIWIMRLPLRDRWVSTYGPGTFRFRDAFTALRNEPRYQQALRKYGIDDGTLANIQVHTDGLWD